jgi:hypothetical protein
MKKVKITLKSGSSGKKFYLFPSAEALYVWFSSLEKNEPCPAIDGIDEFVLEPGGFIEAELRGFEYVYEDTQKFQRLELVRLGLAQPTKNASGSIVTIHSGWVTGGLLPMKQYSDADIDVRLMTSIDDVKLDLPALFKDETPKEDDADDGSVDITDDVEDVTDDAQPDDDDLDDLIDEDPDPDDDDD